MIVDVHTHIFPPEIVRERYRFFSGEPAFESLYASPGARLATADSLLEAMDRDGVDRAVVFGFPWETPDSGARHNDYILNAAAKCAPRLIPLACVNVLARGCVAEAERCLASGARGLGELAIYGATGIPSALEAFREVVACCRSHQGVLLVHANEPVGHHYPGKAPLGLDFFYGLAKLAARTPLILAHWGGGLGFYELLKREAREVLSDVFYDTAASPFLYEPSIYAVMAKILGKTKILFGSDYPLLPPGRYFKEMAEAGMAPDELAAICGDNAMKLFPDR